MKRIKFVHHDPVWLEIVKEQYAKRIHYGRVDHGDACNDGISRLQLELRPNMALRYPLTCLPLFPRLAKESFPAVQLFSAEKAPPGSYSNVLPKGWKPTRESLRELASKAAK